MLAALVGCAPVDDELAPEEVPHCSAALDVLEAPPAVWAGTEPISNEGVPLLRPGLPRGAPAEPAVGRGAAPSARQAAELIHWVPR